ncbi:MAG: hypothetical protein JST28_04710 [Acidobacteria bacterium]|nr:hypothetical protein [Acidobacteriota bacterium]
MFSLGRSARILSAYFLFAVFFWLPFVAPAQTTTANEWTWAGGSKTGSVYYPLPAVYGTLGIPAVGNIPGGRWRATTWTDSNNHLWLFGGWGYDSNSNFQWFNDVWEFDPSAGTWAWMGGSNNPISSGACNQSEVQGTLGVPAPGNVPSARYGAAGWTDQRGLLWLFGGSTCNNREVNDLWQFDPSTRQWALMEASTPAGVYGALGTASAGNIPGGRVGSATWNDLNGGLWIFGGLGFDSKKNEGYLNDLWRYDTATGEWTWISGSSTLPTPGLESWPGVYGTRGTAAPENIPGGRSGAIGWSAVNGRLWLFGGSNHDPNAGQGLLNDLWMFDPSIGEWTWMNGSNSLPVCTSSSGMCGPTGIYGTIGTPQPTNTPGGRTSSTYWTEKTGRFWLFGGDGFNADAGENGWLNDLWSLDPNNGEWTWMGGNSATYCSGLPCPQTGTYGSLNVPSGANYPGGRSSAASWTDNNGNFWLYGGAGFDSTANDNYLDDLWVMQPSDTVNLPKPGFDLVAAPTALSVSAGQSASTTISLVTTGGFNSTVSFACSGLPAGASCNFSPSSLTPSGAASTKLTISTSASSSMLQLKNSALPLSAVAMTLWCFGFKKRSRIRPLALIVFGLAVLGGISSCGGGGGSSPSGQGSHPSISSVTVTGTSGADQHSLTISLTMN